MKKLCIASLLCFMISITLQAQDISPYAVGIRLADGAIGNEGFGPEVTFQKQILSNHNRIDLSASFRTNSWRSTYRAGGYFHWTYNIVDQLNWFAGPGAGIAYIDFDNVIAFGFSNTRDSKLFPFIGGDFGVDYRFDFPLQVAFSIRPTFDIHSIDNRLGLNDVDQFNVNVGIAARYTF